MNIWVNKSMSDAAKIEEQSENIVVGVEESEAPQPPDFERRDKSEENGLKRAIFNVPIEVVVSVGTARPLIGDLLAMKRNELLSLNSSIDDPVELRVGEQVIARGHLAQSDDEKDRLAVKLTEIINISELAE